MRIRALGFVAAVLAVGAGTKGESLVLALAALFLASASVDAPPALTFESPWWERFTFTMTGDGTQQSCSYQTNMDSSGTQSCGEDQSSTPMQHHASAGGASYTKITVERRFTPAARPDPLSVQAGDTLLGGQVLALAIDKAGAVQACQVVGAQGDLTPPYGCDEAKTEKFDASATRSTAPVRHAFMTVLVYGHEEYPV